MSPRKLFVQEMEDLRQDVLQMGEWVIDGYTCLFETLEKKDGETMSRFVRHDRVIGDMQRNIEARCLNLLTRQTPVAGDLRTVSASLKIASDLERIGNHLSDMAELFTRMGYVDLNTISSYFGPMIAETKVSAEKSVKAFVERNMDLAREVIKLDEPQSHKTGVPGIKGIPVSAGRIVANIAPAAVDRPDHIGQRHSGHDILGQGKSFPGAVAPNLIKLMIFAKRLAFWSGDAQRNRFPAVRSHKDGAQKQIDIAMSPFAETHTDMFMNRFA